MRLHPKESSSAFSLRTATCGTTASRFGDAFTLKLHERPQRHKVPKWASPVVPSNDDSLRDLVYPPAVSYHYTPQHMPVVPQTGTAVFRTVLNELHHKDKGTECL